MQKLKVTRRQFLGGAAATVAALAIVPSNVLGGPGKAAPSDSFGGALVGCGDRGPGGTWGFMSGGLNVRRLAECDVKFVKEADNKNKYTDFRRVMERKDIDVVAIATPPHWHALVTIAAMQSGKDVVCEKPMTRFVAEGRAVVEAERRYKRIFQVGIDYRYGERGRRESVITNKIMTSGVLGDKCKGVFIHRGGFKVRAWSGLVNVAPQPVPDWLDWDMYCGPSPLRPFHPHRYGGSHRGYWDYDGGGLGDMGQHYLDAMNWKYGLDYTSPVEIKTYAPPAHPECAGEWGWSEMRYASGFTVVLANDDWADPEGVGLMFGCGTQGGARVRHPTFQGRLSVGGAVRLPPATRNPIPCGDQEFTMTIDEKVRKTLAELGVSDAAGVEAVFAEVRAAMEQEKSRPDFTRRRLRIRARQADAKIFATDGWRARMGC